MLKNLVRYDKLLLLLLENSNHTIVQLDTLISHLIIHRSHGKLEEMMSVKDGPKITKGSFLRSLEQARGNTRSSIYSILLLGYLGFADHNFMDGLIRISRMLEELKQTGYVNNPNEIITLIDKLCNRLSDT